MKGSYALSSCKYASRLTEGQCCNNCEDAKDTWNAKAGGQFSISTAECHIHCPLYAGSCKLTQELQITAVKYYDVCIYMCYVQTSTYSI